MPANLGTEAVTVQHPLTRYARDAGWTIVPQDQATTLRRGESGLLVNLIVHVGMFDDGIELAFHFMQSAECVESRGIFLDVKFARGAGLNGHVFNHYGFGGYLISAGVPTFIDGRGELYGGEFIKGYVEAVNLLGEEPLDKLLDRWRIDWTLLAKDTPANKLLARLPGWHRAYSDEQATIFVRDR